MEFAFIEPGLLEKMLDTVAENNAAAVANYSAPAGSPVLDSFYPTGLTVRLIGLSRDEGNLAAVYSGKSRTPAGDIAFIVIHHLMTEMLPGKQTPAYVIELGSEDDYLFHQKGEGKLLESLYASIANAMVRYFCSVHQCQGSEEIG